MTIDPYTHLTDRCNELIRKYIDPVITSEQLALSNSQTLPQPDYDSFAAFRLLTHAELEDYFEQKALIVLNKLEEDFKKNIVLTASFASLIFYYLQKRHISYAWSARGEIDEKSIKKKDSSDIKRLAQEALGFGREFVKANNGIKENSITALSSFMGFFQDELDDLLIEELNQFGKDRGDVAHESWTKNTHTFSSADIEKNKVLTILKLTHQFYETPNIGPRVSRSNLSSIKKSIGSLPMFMKNLKIRLESFYIIKTPPS